jgi:hypothetical protein
MSIIEIRRNEVDTWHLVVEKKRNVQFQDQRANLSCQVADLEGWGVAQW